MIPLIFLLAICITCISATLDSHDQATLSSQDTNSHVKLRDRSILPRSTAGDDHPFKLLPRGSTQRTRPPKRQPGAQTSSRSRSQDASQPKISLSDKAGKSGIEQPKRIERSGSSSENLQSSVGDPEQRQHLLDLYESHKSTVEQQSKEWRNYLQRYGPKGKISQDLKSWIAPSRSTLPAARRPASSTKSKEDQQEQSSKALSDLERLRSWINPTQKQQSELSQKSIPSSRPRSKVGSTKGQKIQSAGQPWSSKSSADPIILADGASFEKVLKHTESRINILKRLAETDTSSRPTTQSIRSSSEIEAKSARDKAIKHLKEASQAFQNGRATSPTTEAKFANAKEAVTRSLELDVGTMYEHIHKSQVAARGRRWTDAVRHDRGSVIAKARADARGAYWQAINEDYQQKLARGQDIHWDTMQHIDRIIGERQPAHVKQYFAAYDKYRRARQVLSDSDSEEEMLPLTYPLNP